MVERRLVGEPSGLRAASGSPNSGVKKYRKHPAAPIHSICQVKEPLSLLRIPLGSCLSCFRRSHRPIASVYKDVESLLWNVGIGLFYVSRGCEPEKRMQFQLSLFGWSEIAKGG